MELSALSPLGFAVPNCNRLAEQPQLHVTHARCEQARSQRSNAQSLCLASLAAAACARCAVKRRAYGGYSGGYGGRMDGEEVRRRTEMKRERETQQFYMFQRQIISRGGVQPKDDAHWDALETRIFGQSHVKAGINFAKYDSIEVTAEGGTGKEQPISSFQEACEKYQLPDELTANLERCGYDTPTPVQKYSIPAVLEGSDVMVSAQTGSGKTAAFLVPIITAALQAGPKELTEEGAVCPTSVILAPTRELCEQIAQEAKRLTFRSFARVAAIYGGADALQQLRDIAGGVEIVVCAPGRMDDFLQRGVVSMEGVKFLVVDEADRMLDMGFEPQIRNIIENYGMPEPGEGGRQTMMFSATFPQEMQDMALDFLDPAYYGIKVGQVGHAATDVEQCFEQVNFREKNDRLLDLMTQASSENGELGKTLVFANTKNTVDDIVWILNDRGIKAEPIHGGLTQGARSRNLTLLKKGVLQVLVATDVAARGLDLPGIEHVINYDLPQDGDTYVHRIGRTGRIGNKGRATSFVSNYDSASNLKMIVRHIKDAKKDDPDASDVPEWLEGVPVAVGAEAEEEDDTSRLQLPSSGSQHLAKVRMHQTGPREPPAMAPAERSSMGSARQVLRVFLEFSDGEEDRSDALNLEKRFIDLSFVAITAHIRTDRNKPHDDSSSLSVQS
ncbi:ded1 [Symbiodinium sp. CCMP2456]|nr:ded1 [Symbiodinium sp. CCMP2456]